MFLIGLNSEESMSEETKNPLPIVSRTSAGLRNALFDELDNLRAGTTNATKANATARIAAAIVGTVEMELEVHRVMSKLPKDQQVMTSLPPLTLAGNE